MPCTTILVGKKASIDGSTIISRNDDGGYDTKKIIVMEPGKQPAKYKSVISHVEVELPNNPLRYTLCPNVSKENGIWPACGVNELNVAMTATETITSNPRVIGADPYVKYDEKKKDENGKKIPGGIGEEDLVCLVLPYIKSAREGVIRIGELLEKYGTYEANGMAVSDENEIWWLETIGGHHWMAKKVPDDHVVIMPNQFGLDNFDFDDALSAKKENMCSADLKEWTVNNHLYSGDFKEFNPRVVYGSRTDSDHIYNTPRAWYMARYFLERTHSFDGENADYKPESNDIPWSFVPEHPVTIEDVRYLLGSHYQGTPYNPYDKKSNLAGKYRSIGIPNTDVCGIMQIRGYMPEAVKAVEWYSMGGTGFTACFPLYANVSKMPKYVSATTETVDTDYMYWHSRIIAALVDANNKSALIYDERYYNNVFNKARMLLNEYDNAVADMKDADDAAVQAKLEEANQKIADMVKSESDKVLKDVLKIASDNMLIRYHRGDN